MNNAVHESRALNGHSAGASSKSALARADSHGLSGALPDASKHDVHGHRPSLETLSKGAESMVLQLEADLAGLRTELSSSRRPADLEAGAPARGPTRTWQATAVPAELPPSGAAARTSAPAEPSGQAWARRHEQLGDRRSWHGSVLGEQADREVSRLYDELLRLEEEEAECKRRVADVAGTGKSDRGPAGSRRRASSCTNVGARRTHMRG